MSTARPLLFQWNGEAMVPATPFWAKRADEVFTIGERYQLVEHQERSTNSHNHYFASLNEAWRNLPEHLAERFPTSEHLRKFALIQTGWRDERSIVCRSAAEAEKIAAFVRPMDEYGIVTTHAATVIVLTAKSQSARAQGNKDFQASKTAVLEYVAAMIDTPVATLAQNAGRAA